MIALVTAAVLTVLALFLPSHSPYLRVFRPSFLLSFFSALGLAVTWSFFGFEALAERASLLYALGTVAFFMSDYATSALMEAHMPDRPVLGSVNALVRAHWLPYAYLVATVVGTVLLAVIYRQRSSMFNMFELGTALRYAGQVELPTYGAFHFLLFTQAIASVFVLSNRATLRWIGYGCFAILLFGSYVSVSRTTMFFNAGALAFLLYVRTGRVSVIAIPAAAIVGLTFYYAVFANKNDVGESSFFYYYVGYAIYAFNNFILPIHQWDYGINSFGSIGALLSGGLVPDDLSLEGTEYNVYTFIGSPYRDFGMAGVILIPMMFGAIWSFVWNKTGNSAFYVLMYSWMIFPCIIPFFDWKFSLTSYIYLVPVYLALLNPKLTVVSQPSVRGT